MANSSEGVKEVFAIRVSFRSTERNSEKLVAIAKANRWVNSSGAPNISAVLNHIIDSFDVSAIERKKKLKGKKNVRRS